MPIAVIVIAVVGLYDLDFLTNAEDWREDLACAAYYEINPVAATETNNAEIWIKRAAANASEKPSPESEAAIRIKLRYMIKELRAPALSEADQNTQIDALKDSCS
ncbi:hypothetical protein [Thalassospira lucentensis]|uniref:hypothetical protein n=1 Tax=Thalassospira lucentensis TaxID=168935 RepID=UPI0003B324F6|nr:hypothetical protein [Thalassospira lucentensis]RCK21944.1 hypothetical protein TH1_17515 [Thalassospira lucentensis MCCC 1A00383 = DSM 14000]